MERAMMDYWSAKTLAELRRQNSLRKASKEQLRSSLGSRPRVDGSWPWALLLASLIMVFILNQLA